MPLQKPILFLAIRLISTRTGHHQLFFQIEKAYHMLMR